MKTTGQRNLVSFKYLNEAMATQTAKHLFQFNARAATKKNSLYFSFDQNRQ